MEHANDQNPPGGGRHRRRNLVIAAVVVVILVVGVVVVFASSRDGARPVAVEDVEQPTGSTLPTTPSVLRPEQGVYLYEGEGTDRIDRPPMEQAQGPELPATVTHREDGCWTFRIDYSTNHWQTWTYCPTADGGLDEEGGTSYQLWDFGAFTTDTTTSAHCEEAVTIRAHQQPGDTWDQTCVATSTSTDGEGRSSGPVTFVGVETVEVEGQQIEAYHYRRQRTMTGAQTGTEESEVWFAVDTGLPIRNVRSIRASTNTIIGDVTYTEEGEFRLVSGPSAP